MPGIDRNYTWQVGSIPESKPDVEEIKTYYTEELLCRSIIDTPQHATMIYKSDSGASNHLWRMENMLVLTNIKDIRNGPTLKFPNNKNTNAKNMGILPLSRIVSTHEKQTHIFDVLYSDLLISLGQLCDNECISNLNNEEINILKDKKIILNRHRNKTNRLWDIPISRPLRHCAHATITRDKAKT